MKTHGYKAALRQVPRLVLLSAIIVGLLGLAPTLVGTASAQSATKCANDYNQSWFQAEVDRYGKVRGHHILQDAAFRYQPRYKRAGNDNKDLNPDLHSWRSSGLAISQALMRTCGWDHDEMSASQGRQQKALCSNSAIPNTLDVQFDIARRALEDGGVPSNVAKLLAEDAHNKAISWKSYESIFPSRIPACVSPRRMSSTCTTWKDGERYSATVWYNHTPNGVEAGFFDLQYMNLSHETEFLQIFQIGNVLLSSASQYSGEDLPKGLTFADLGSDDASVTIRPNESKVRPGDGKPNTVWLALEAEVVFSESPDISCKMYASPGWNSRQLDRWERNQQTVSFDQAEFDLEVLESQAPFDDELVDAPTPTLTPAPQPGSSGVVLLKHANASDAHMVYPNEGVRRWVNADCVNQIRSAGLAIGSFTNWNTELAIYPGGSTKSCAQYQADLGASTSSTPTPTPTPSPAPAPAPQPGSSGVVLLKHANASDAHMVYPNEGVRRWVNADCMNQIRSAGLSIGSFTNWNTELAIYPGGSTKSCAQYQADLGASTSSTPTPTPTPQPVPSGSSGVVLLKHANASDAHMVYPNEGVRRWVNADCVNQISSAGLAIGSFTNWNTELAIYPGGSTKSCAQYQADLGTVSISTPVPTPSTNSVGEFVAIAGDNHEAWILRTDGTRQWLDAACRSQLTSALGAPRTATWNGDLAHRSDSTNRLSCSQLQNQL